LLISSCAFWSSSYTQIMVCNPSCFFTFDIFVTWLLQPCISES
jgi:hypothetical protein